MPQYEAIIQLLIDANLLTQRQVYFFEDDPLNDAFQLFFNFCTVELTRYQDEYRINPSHFFYENDFEINACAYQRDGRRFISVNRGSIDNLWTFYTDHADIFQDARFAHYIEIAGHKEISAEYFLYQYTTLYFFYHELGHLIQHNDNPVPFQLLENLAESDNEGDALQHQILEFDADWFAATQLAFRLVGYYRNDETGDFNCSVEQLTLVVSLGLSAMFNYYVLSANRFPEIYYKQKSHPHPFVRITNVLTYITENINPNLPIEFNVDYNAALSNAIILSEQFLMQGGINQTKDFAKLFQNEGDNIAAEVNWIKTEAEKNPLLCINQLMRAAS